MNKKVEKTVFSALFLAAGMVLPLLTAQLKELGDSLLPMHFAVLLCGFVCGPRHGLAVGLILPFLRSVVFSAPPIYPNALWMSLELATYGYVAGLLYTKSKKTLVSIYVALIIAMFSGRVVWGVTKALLLGLGGNGFTPMAFIMGGFIDALPGIIIQLITIPFLVKRRKMR